MSTPTSEVKAMDRFLVRSAAVRLFFVALLVLFAMAASAHAAPARSGAGAAAPPELHVSAGLFTPTRTDDGLTWNAHWVLTPESAPELEAEGAARLIRFATPLGPGESVEAGFGVSPFVEYGVVTGVVVERTAADGRTVRGIVHQRLTGEGREIAHLGAPVAAGSALQIVDADLGAGTRLEIETGRVLERHVGFIAPPGIGHAAREEARRLTGYEARVNGAALYVRGDDVRATNGLHAGVVTPAARAHSGTIALAIVFAAIVAALFAAVRRLRGAASVERADALLAAEVDALDASSHALDAPHAPHAPHAPRAAAVTGAR
jgi:hypothetical protein